ncbi:hypothetical protein LUZ60_000487 [Juncus effusus]|nr:hypothetical protein LUZ60_000487 [Juncus effusus]
MARDTVPVREAMTRKASLSDLLMEFFEDPLGNNGGGARELGDESSDYEENEGNSEEDKVFWTTLHQDLQETLSKDSSAERRIRSDTEESVRKMQSEPSICSCSDRIITKDFCRKCALKYLAEQLRAKGYNSAFCKSKWTHSPDIPSGEHSYVDVLVDSKSRKQNPDSKTGKRNPIRIVIERNFRAEFLISRPSPQYSKLVNSLPELFVGKSEKLKTVVRIVCNAAKKCMKDNKMHMGPWRKHKYMSSKWLSTPERITSGISGISGISDVSGDCELGLGFERKQKASMLSFDFNYTAMKVV